jgi:RNA polymerase sigma factor (sigma-70 family)
MRGLTIDYVRRRQAKKRGGEFQITASGVEQVGGATPAEPLEQLSTALDTLAASEPDLAQLVDLHFFCGFSFAELAELQGVSERTIRRHWRNARLLLHRTMQDL